MVYEDMTDQAPCFPFYFRQILAGPHENFHFVFGDPVTKQAAVVDPAFELERLFSLVERDGYTIKDALFTHGHWDHIGGAPEIFDRGVQRAYIHRAAGRVPQVEAHEDRFHFLDDGDRLLVGSVPVEVLHTPGHQPEASCFLVGEPGGDGPEAPRALFGGDTLFVDACGRTDFPGGDTEAMFASMARLRSLPDEVVLFPGHHYAEHPNRSLGAQKVENPALATTDRDAFGRLHCLTN